MFVNGFVVCNFGSASKSHVESVLAEGTDNVYALVSHLGMGRMVWEVTLEDYRVLLKVGNNETSI